jgi:hypothetical protein
MWGLPEGGSPFFFVALLLLLIGWYIDKDNLLIMDI